MTDYKDLLKQLADMWIEIHKVNKNDKKAVKEFAEWLDSVMTQAEHEDKAKQKA